MSAGGAQAVADVDNSLVDAHASDGAAIITTDGAGQASVDVTVVGACEGKAAGEVVNVPVTVATDFATVVEASDGLSIPVTCAGVAAPSPSTDSGEGSKPVVSVPEVRRRIQARPSQAVCWRERARIRKGYLWRVCLLCVASSGFGHVVPKSLPTGKRFALT